MDINIEVIGKNIEVTEKIQDYVTKKVSKLGRLLNEIEEIRVDLAYVKTARNAVDRQVAQITIRGRGFILRTEERSDDIFAAIDASQEKMLRQMERFKGKRRRARGDGTPTSEAAAEPVVAEEAEETTPVIVRRKRFTLHPMDELEAIEQMTLLGHENFFIFYNANTSEINVLYKRRDGTYGLIEPAVG